MPNQWTGPAPLEPRYWSKVNKTAQHWLWAGKRINKGYGVLVVAGRNVLVHRLAWEFAEGASIPDGMIIGHVCDTPLCVRNDEPGVYEVGGITYPRRGHLFLATYSANTVDMMTKKRYGFYVHPETRPTGDRHRSVTHPESVLPRRSEPARHNQRSGRCRNTMSLRVWRRSSGRSSRRVWLGPDAGITNYPR